MEKEEKHCHKKYSTLTCLTKRATVFIATWIAKTMTIQMTIHPH